jgi:hypothetical protein
MTQPRLVSWYTEFPQGNKTQQAIPQYWHSGSVSSLLSAVFLVLGTGPGERKRGRRARVGLSVLGWPPALSTPLGLAGWPLSPKRLQAAAAGAVAVVSAQCVSEEVQAVLLSKLCKLPLGLCASTMADR